MGSRKKGVLGGHPPQHEENGENLSGGCCLKFYMLYLLQRLLFLHIHRFTAFLAARGRLRIPSI